jgi:tetrahydromethanopterin S-methyltransferase subunit D
MRKEKQVMIHTMASILESNIFSGHCSISSFEILGDGGFHNPKYGKRANAPKKKERLVNGQIGILLLSL